VRTPVAGGALSVEAPSDILPLLRRSWLPPNGSSPSETRAVIRISRGASPPRPPQTAPTLRLGTAHLWMQDRAAAVLSGTGGCWGTVDLETLRAELVMPLGADANAGSDAYSMLTISAALLLGRTGRILMHSGAVVSPGRTAWLLTGDSHSGKSTTTVNLISHGWDYLSDDQVILSGAPGNDEVTVDGWLRPFHLDEGWARGTPALRRATVDSTSLGLPGRPVGRASLGFLLFPTVVAQEPTSISPVPAVDAIAGLVRQSPWLLADPVAAPAVLELLKTIAMKPAYRLSLGLDTFKHGDRLAGILLQGTRTADRPRASRRDPGASCRAPDAEG
jgi:hypothetical protein